MTVHDLVELSERIAQERSSARAIISSLSEEAWEGPVPEAWQTAGFVQELVSVAHAQMERDPQRSLRLAQFAVTVASMIKEPAYGSVVHRQLEGSAWLQVARSHRNMSQFEPALRALDRADARFGSTAALGHDQVIALTQRAIIFSEMRRFDESMKLLDEVEPLFRDYGDTTRLNHVAMVRGTIYFRTMQLERACEIFEELVARMQHDRDNMAFLLGNLASARFALGDYDGAMDAYQRSRALAEELNMPTEVTRADWKLGRALMAKGEWSAAIDLLQRVRVEFRLRALPEESGLCALDIVECLVATAQQQPAVDLTTAVMNEFLAANLNQRAMTALSYLRDLLPDRTRAKPAVQHVRSYVERLKREPELLFLPLP